MIKIPFPWEFPKTQHSVCNFVAIPGIFADHHLRFLRREPREELVDLDDPVLAAAPESSTQKPRGVFVGKWPRIVGSFHGLVMLRRGIKGPVGMYNSFFEGWDYSNPYDYGR